MAYEPKPGSFSLFKNDRKEKDTHPDMRPISGIDGAFICADGTILRDGLEKRPSISAVGYKVVTFSVKNKTQTKYLHRLLLEAFVGPCPPAHEALHINGDRLDNRLENLRWGTRKENVADAIRHGTATVGLRNGGAKLTKSDLGWIRDMRDMGFKPREIHHHFGVSVGTMQRAMTGQTYKGEMA